MGASFSPEIQKQQQVAATILQQLGGKMFIAMTGSSNFMATETGLRMNLSKNKSGAGYLYIDLCNDDTYTMRFKKFNKKTFEVSTVVEFDGVYCDMLRECFTEITGLYTHP